MRKPRPPWGLSCRKRGQARGGFEGRNRAERGAMAATPGQGLDHRSNAPGHALLEARGLPIGKLIPTARRDHDIPEHVKNAKRQPT